MSGNIATSDIDNGTLLYATLMECEKEGWITLSLFGAGFNKVEITNAGREMVQNRRMANSGTSAVDRRRTPKG